MIALALLFAALAPDDGLADQIAHCGIARDQIAVRYEDGLQDETATIATPAAVLTGNQLNCLAGLAMSGRVFVFADPAAQKRFDPVIATADRKAATAEARQWLADDGVLDRLPVYDPARQTLAEFGVSLESLCGLPAGAALRATGKFLILAPPADPEPSEAELARFQCVISASIAANTAGLYSVGFLGNGQEKAEGSR